MKAIDLLEAALGAPSAPAAVAAALDNVQPVQAPITPPRMPMMRKPAPIALGRPDIAIDVGRHGSPQPPPPTRPGVLAGIKKPETNRPAQEPDRPPMKAARQPPKMTGWLPDDDEVPF